MTCHCACKCDNLLTITTGDICGQCWKGSHRVELNPLTEDPAYGAIINRLHEAFCGQVPGYKEADLFGHHEELALAVLRVLKGARS